MPWQDDGTRYQGNPEARAAFHERCKELLREVGANWRLVSGSSLERRAQCVRETALSKMPVYLLA